MRVLTLINGSLLSEAASHFAIYYAAEVRLPVTALFINNGKESVERAQASAEVLQSLCDEHQVEFEYIQLEGEVVAQLEHYCQLYAIDTLFCATRRQSTSPSFSDKIVNAAVETDVAVVKLKNLGNLDQPNRVLLVASERVNPHAYVLWLGLVKHGKAGGLIYLSEHSTFLKAKTKSGLKYQAAPFMQIAALAGCENNCVEVINSPEPMSVEQMLHFQVEQPVDLAVYTQGAYSDRDLKRLGEESSINTIHFHPWII